jgi:hypothetical protein
MRYKARSFLEARLSSLFAAAMMLLAVCCAAQAGEQCATEPNSKATQGHWYYRVDRVTQRKCWFLAQSGMKVRAPAKAQSAAKPPQPPAASAPKVQQMTTSGCPCPDQPAAMAQDPGIAQPLAAAPAALPEPQIDAQPEVNYVGNTRYELPLDAVSGPDASPDKPPTRIPVEPAHLLALLAAALGLAALGARLLFNYSVLFSA